MSAEECNAELSQEYDLAMHIGSVFIIMSFSFLGTTIPFIFKKYFSTSSLIFQSAKLVGSGVILSTAFNHMLTAAFENLSSPCAEIEYGALAGVCALIGVLFTLVVQLIASETLSHLVSEESKADKEAINDHSQNHSTIKNIINEEADSHLNSKNNQCLGDINILEIGESSGQDNSCKDVHTHARHKYVDSGHNHSHGGVISHSNRISAYLLEFGIAIHSVIIGVALGVAREEFISLFIALVFHQFFEGIGLSSVISEAEFKKKWMAGILVVFYTLSTPIGIVIGIGLHTTLNGSAKDYLVTQGVLDGLSAGILIYDGLVNIVIPHFNGNNYRHSPPSRKAVHVISLVMGSFIMAIVALWA